MQKETNSILLSLKQHLKKVSDVIIDKNDVLYFDYPLHLNVGDLLIYAGTEAFFKHENIHIRLRRCLPAFDINEVKKYINKNTAPPYLPTLYGNAQILAIPTAEPTQVSMNPIFD